MRVASRAVVMALAATMASFSTGLAQAAPAGTLTGHVTFCRFAPGPIAAPETPNGNPNLVDVTPGMNRAFARAQRIPASGLQLTVQGTSLSAQTDANGAFTISGVPSAQPLTVLAMVSDGPPLVVSGNSLSLNAGQTMDLGNLSTPGCADPNAPFTLQLVPTSPPAATDDTTVQAPDPGTADAIATNSTDAGSTTPSG